MCYIKANKVLPEEVIALIQEYIDGEYIYIPKKADKRQRWGSKTSTREEISIRNSTIYKEYIIGISRNDLAEKYFLSKKSIDRIILQEKNKELEG